MALTVNKEQQPFIPRPGLLYMAPADPPGVFTRHCSGQSNYNRAFVTLFCLGGLAISTALKVASYYQANGFYAQNPEAHKTYYNSLITSVCMGLSIGALLKTYLPTHVDQVRDEMTMLTAPVWVQAITQAEQNIYSSPLHVELLFSALQIHFGIVLLSEVVNTLSAKNPLPNLSLSVEDERPRDHLHEFKFAVLSQLLFIITAVALLAMGIHLRENLLINLGAFLGARAVCSLVVEAMLPCIRPIRQAHEASLAPGALRYRSPQVQLMDICYRVAPLGLTLLLAGLATHNTWWCFTAFGVSTGMGRTLKWDEGNDRSVAQLDVSESSSPRLVEVLTPCPHNLADSNPDVIVTTSRKVIDVTKTIFTCLTLAGVLAWTVFWMVKDPDSLSILQLSTAGIACLIAYLGSCIIYAYCSDRRTALQNHLIFQLKNIEDFLGPIYLAFFNRSYGKQDAKRSLLTMWALWSTLLIVPMVTMTKNGKPVLLVAPLIYFLWQAFIAINYAEGKFQG